MKLIVKAKKQWTPKYRDEILEAAAIGIKRLELEDLNIVIKLCGIRYEVEWVGDESDEYQTWGYAYGLRNTYYVQLFFDANKARRLDAVFHELVHVAQYKAGKLEITETDVFWFGKKMLDDVDGGKNFELYANLPWEVEARNMASNFMTYYYPGLLEHEDE